MRNFGVELNGVEPTFRILRSGYCIICCCQNFKTWQSCDLVTMAHPDGRLSRYICQQNAWRGLPQSRPPKFTLIRRNNLPIQEISHQLHSVADSQDGNAQIEHCTVAMRST